MEKQRDVLNINELASYLDITKSTIYKLVRKSKIPGQKVERHWRFHKKTIEAFFKREVFPHALDAWVDDAKTQIGHEISFTRHFYKPTSLCSLDEIRADLLKLQKEGEGLLEQIVSSERRG